MVKILEENSTADVQALPGWFRQDLPDMDKIRRMKEMFRS